MSTFVIGLLLLFVAFLVMGSTAGMVTVAILFIVLGLIESLGA